MIEDALFARASAFGGLTTLIGTAPVRFHPQMLPESPTYPAATYMLVSSPREQLMGVDPGIVSARFQCSAWGLQYADSRAVAEQLRKCFERFRGTVSGVVILDILDWDAHDAPPELVNGVLVRQRVTECKVYYRE